MSSSNCPFRVRFSWLLSTLILGLFITSSAPRPLSNTFLPSDSDGNVIKTGEADVLYDAAENVYYIFVNDWGGCRGIDCCSSSGGCASCCFSPPSPEYPDTCVYTNNHTVLVYKTNLESWVYMGEALSVSSRSVGTEFRPHVLYNNVTQKYVMWYEDRFDGQEGYSIAVADVAQGPYQTIANTVLMSSDYRIGDFDLFLDPDTGEAFHVRTGLVVEKLNQTFTGVTGEYVTLPAAAEPVEAPVMFKREGIYYILAGSDCCACKGGSSILVYTATSAMGPYQFRGDVGSNTSLSHTFNPHSPFNYVTKAQASAVFQVGDEYVWLGNQWVTAEKMQVDANSQVGLVGTVNGTTSAGARNQDLLYWSILQFEVDGNLTQFIYQDMINVSFS